MSFKKKIVLNLFSSLVLGNIFKYNDQSSSYRFFKNKNKKQKKNNNKKRKLFFKMLYTIHEDSPVSSVAEDNTEEIPPWLLRLRVLTFLHKGLPGVITFSDNMEEFKDDVISSL